MKTTAIITLLVLAVSSVSWAADGPSIPRADLKRLIKNANKPEDYQRLADFFHHKEEVYRAKAQAEMADYASFARNIMIVPKFQTRADQDLRLFEYYSAMADKQAKLAAHYDEILVRIGIKPASRAHSISFKDSTNSLSSRLEDFDS